MNSQHVLKKKQISKNLDNIYKEVSQKPLYILDTVKEIFLSLVWHTKYAEGDFFNKLIFNWKPKNLNVKYHFSTGSWHLNY